MSLDDDPRWQEFQAWVDRAAASAHRQARVERAARAMREAEEVLREARELIAGLKP